jgi:hypothetical protein
VAAIGAVILLATAPLGALPNSNVGLAPPYQVHNRRSSLNNGARGTGQSWRRRAGGGPPPAPAWQSKRRGPQRLPRPASGTAPPLAARHQPLPNGKFKTLGPSSGLPPPPPSAASLARPAAYAAGAASAGGASRLPSAPTAGAPHQTLCTTPHASAPGGRRQQLPHRPHLTTWLMSNPPGSPRRAGSKQPPCSWPVPHTCPASTKHPARCNLDTRADAGWHPCGTRATSSKRRAAAASRGLPNMLATKLLGRLRCAPGDVGVQQLPRGAGCDAPLARWKSGRMHAPAAGYTAQPASRRRGCGRTLSLGHQAWPSPLGCPASLAATLNRFLGRRRLCSCCCRQQQQRAPILLQPPATSLSCQLYGYK